MRRSILCGLIVLGSLSPAWGQQLVREFSSASWDTIDNPSDEAKTVAVLDLKNPGVTAIHYAIEGEVRYENVQGKSYLEMWNWFADGGMYFSRTLGNSGPMRHLEGSSGWRSFSLPFFSDAKSGPPTRIVVNVVFVGRGTVHLRGLKLYQYRSGWWTEQQAGWVGGIGGSIIGLLGGLLGTLGGFGKARRFVLTMLVALATLGVVSLIVGLYALVIGQPYEVYYVLLLSGIILAGVCGVNFWTMRRAYQLRELRKMAAMDAGLTTQ
jgi:hypothetical protein